MRPRPRRPPARLGGRAPGAAVWDGRGHDGVGGESAATSRGRTASHEGARFPRSDRAVRSDLKRPRVARLAHAAAAAARPSCAPPAVRATRSRVSNQRRRTCRRSGKRGSEDSVGHELLEMA